MGQMVKKWIFGSVPKSPTQMGSLSVKNASEKFSRLGTFKAVYFSQRKVIWTCIHEVQLLPGSKGTLIFFAILIFLYGKVKVNVSYNFN
jgi:hypothetical protein